MIPNLYASVFLKGVVSSLRNLYVTNKSIVPTHYIFPNISKTSKSGCISSNSPGLILFRKIRNDLRSGQYVG